ncbi:hypothetical protein TNCV_206031 [Trichonephila clavipes]|nr:hypothetical protein TNCV_206031 [Trichonephila clavipes]
MKAEALDDGEYACALFAATLAMKLHFTCRLYVSTMECYTNAKLIDMHLTYRGADSNERHAQRVYAQCYPRGKLPATPSSKA